MPPEPKLGSKIGTCPKCGAPVRFTLLSSASPTCTCLEEEHIWRHQVVDLLTEIAAKIGNTSHVGGG